MVETHEIWADNLCDHGAQTGPRTRSASCLGLWDLLQSSFRAQVYISHTGVIANAAIFHTYAYPASPSAKSNAEERGGQPLHCEWLQSSVEPLYRSINASGLIGRPFVLESRQLNFVPMDLGCHKGQLDESFSTQFIIGANFSATPPNLATVSMQPCLFLLLGLLASWRGDCGIDFEKLSESVLRNSFDIACEANDLDTVKTLVLNECECGGIGLSTQPLRRSATAFLLYSTPC